MKEGWKTESLGEIVDILDNLRKPITKKDRIEGDFPYYGATGILSYVHDYIFSEKLILVGEDGAKWESGENSAFIADGKYWVNNHAHVIRPHHDKVSYDWLVYYLNHCDLLPFVSGMTVPKLNQKNLRSIPIPLPPVAEQQQIVSILGPITVAIDQAKANAKKNLQNAKELFESSVRKVMDELELEHNQTTLGVSCEFFNGKAHEKEIDISGDYIVVNSKFISSEGETIKKTANQMFPLFTNDIVMVMSDVPNGKALAKCAIIDEDNIYSLNQRICCIRSENYDTKFLYYQLNRHPYLLAFNNGENQTNLRKGDILNTPLTLPEIEVQRAVSSKLDEVKNQAKQLETIYQKKLNDLEELKRSILEKAFKGELVNNRALETT